MTEYVACSESDLVDQALTHVLALHRATQARGGTGCVGNRRVSPVRWVMSADEANARRVDASAVRADLILHITSVREHDLHRSPSPPV